MVRAGSTYLMYLWVCEGLHGHIYALLAAEVIACGGQQGHLLDAPLPWNPSCADQARLGCGLLRHLTCLTRNVIQICVCACKQHREGQAC